MTSSFSSRELQRMGWQQGAIFGDDLASLAWERSPDHVERTDGNLLVLVSHDCDVLNHKLGKEPFVELIRASTATGHRAGHIAMAGRSPRELWLSDIRIGGSVVALHASVHDRWTIPRKLLAEERPAGLLDPRDKRLMSEWLAKRYFRPAFPTAFDRRWRHKSKDWQRLLREHSPWIYGVYIRLDAPRKELPDDLPYVCDLLLAVTTDKVARSGWPRAMRRMGNEFAHFWAQFRPGIDCQTVNIETTTSISLADIERYQRIDADWISFRDGTDVVSLDLDFRT